MKLDIPNQKMSEKLGGLLSDVPGEFRRRPRIVPGLEQLTIFRDNGIPCPQFTVHLKEAKKWVEAGDVVFGRDRSHEKGADIVVQGSTWDRKEFWSKFIPSSREYRIHIFANEQIQQSLKTFNPNAPRRRTDGLPIRNTETGWEYDHAFNPRPAAVDLAKRAVRILGYLWGGVDFLEGTNGTCYVLEVNSAPGMDDTTAHAYADAIKKYAEQSNQYGKR
ncbi:MAG TPA: hypothetical protein VGI46_00615 [Candidatus Acidoferrum sp.]|jgi:hypothetical protein